MLEDSNRLQEELDLKAGLFELIFPVRCDDALNALQ